VKAENALEQKQESFKEKWESTKQRSTLLLSLPETSIAEGKQVFKIENFNFRYHDAEQQLWPNENLDLVMKGPRRWALAGSNGSGKSTLIDVLTRQSRADRGIITGEAALADIPWAYLDQSYALLKAEHSVLENVMDGSQRDLKDLRNQLALFQFFGEMVHQQVASLSQGEKLKCALAKLLLASPAPQFLILDEPTNNLDLQSLAILEQALGDYEGALLVVSHDEVFLNNIQIEQLIQLD
jgi:ATPase subunit of ABC transporter with duplicated ATPase domains